MGCCARQEGRRAGTGGSGGGCQDVQTRAIHKYAPELKQPLSDSQLISARTDTGPAAAAQRGAQRAAGARLAAALMAATDARRLAGAGTTAAAARWLVRVERQATAAAEMQAIAVAMALKL